MLSFVQICINRASPFSSDGLKPIHLPSHLKIFLTNKNVLQQGSRRLLLGQRCHGPEYHHRRPHVQHQCRLPPEPFEILPYLGGGSFWTWSIHGRIYSPSPGHIHRPFPSLPCRS